MRCPRCNGRVFRDLYNDASCLMCGWVDNPPPSPEAIAEMPRRERAHDHVRAEPQQMQAVCDRCGKTREIQKTHQPARFCRTCAQKLNTVHGNIALALRRLAVRP